MSVSHHVAAAPTGPSARVGVGLSVPVAAALLWVSGACGLIYEVVWARELVLQLGHTATAHATVVATFMAGLGLGYVWIAPRADSAARPLRVYGLLEAAIALWCVLSTLGLFELVGSWQLGGAAGRALAAAVVMAVPTICMGMTLPLLVAAISREPDAGGKALASLYAANSLGAVFGALAAGFALIEALGLTSTIHLAAACNAGVALAALGLSARGQPTPVAAPRAPVAQAAVSASSQPSDPHDHAPIATRPADVALWVAGVAGLVSLSLQGLWFRLFGVVLGSSTYSFSVVVAAFIGGLALGGAGVRAWLGRRRAAPQHLAWLLLLAAAGVLGGGLVASRLPWLFAAIRFRVGQGSADHLWFEAAKLGLVSTLIVPVTALIGAVLPLAGRLQMGEVGQTGRGAARAFGANTLGSVLGASVAGTFLVPTLGLEGLLRASSVALAAAGAWTLCSGAVTTAPPRPPLPARRCVSSWGLSAAVLVAVASLALPMDWDTRVLSAGAFRGPPRDPGAFETWSAALRREQVLFSHHGPDATVAVLERDGRRVLKVNGKPDASNRGDMLTQVLSAHLPLLLHPAPRRVLVIGLGSGITAGSAALHDVEIDVVEISQGVVDASRLFDEASGAPLDRSGVRLHLADARHWLASTEQQFDVIISEPSNPWMAGNAALFSAEYFELVRSRLAPGGLLAQWFHAYEMNDALLELVLRTVRSALPHAGLWELFPQDLLLVAGAQPREIDLDSLGARAFSRAVSADLARVDVEGPSALLSLEAIPPARLGQLLAAPGPVHRDDRPVLEFRAPRALFAGSHATFVDRHDVRRWPMEGTATAFERWVAAHPLGDRELQGLYRLHTRFPGAPEAFRMGMVPGLTGGTDPEFLADLVFTLTREGRFGLGEQAATRLMQVGADRPRALYAVALLQRARAQVTAKHKRQQSLSATHLFKRCVALGDTRGRCARALAAAGQPHPANHDASSPEPPQGQPAAR